MDEINQWASAICYLRDNVRRVGQTFRQPATMLSPLISVLALPAEGDGGCVVRVLRTAALGNVPLRLVLHLWAVLLLGTTNAAPW
jgi:hypothetical protein